MLPSCPERTTRRPLLTTRFALLALAVSLSACAYPGIQEDGAANVVVDGDHVFVARGLAGIDVLDAGDGSLEATIAPPGDMGSIDDLSVADGLLFGLDARAPGFLSVWSLTEPGNPSRVGEPQAVVLQRFSGVSAAGGRVVVSGGTEQLSVRTYAPDGALGSETGLITLGDGAPDVLISPDGLRAFASTNIQNSSFGPTFLSLPEPPGSPTVDAQLDLPGADFTNGGANPANFPLESALVGDHLLMAFARGLAVYDVTPGQEPAFVTVVETEVGGVSVDARDGVAALVGNKPEPAVVFFDVSNPATPLLTEERLLTDLATRPVGVAVGPSALRVFVADSVSGVVVVEQ